MTGQRASRLRLIGFIVLLVGTWLIVGGVMAQNGTVSISGIIVDEAGPVVGAVVRVRNTDNATATDSTGAFTLDGLAAGEEAEITAWADGYYITYLHVTPPAAEVTLTLRPYHRVDHPDYAWPSPLPGTGEGACGDCHPMIIGQWAGNAHGGAVSNPRFFSMYNGTDLSGEQPVGHGYVQDFPGTVGNCAQCHAPGAGLDGYLTVDMNAVRGEITAGIHCDYCHKIGGVYLDPATGSVYPNAPGAQSTHMLRPPPGDNIFLGPFDDIHDPDTRLPLISESAFCAPCHQFSMWGTPIYESYTEWLASLYAEDNVTCQDCHMPPSGAAYFALPEVGGLAHDPESIPSHLQLGAASEALLQETVTLSAIAERHAGALVVNVAITNSGAGHHVPTDYPGRHLILTVEAVAADGDALAFRSGPTVPAWGGAQAGLPGAAFAKLLQDAVTGEMPVVSYWRQTFIVEDTRIPALGTHESQYFFGLGNSAETLTITVRLIFRRLFQTEAEARGWDVPDVVMETVDIVLPVP
ncbi:MAG: carboxypeptidase regulatory-like domain-containing protein, partial [Anaerolineae bacterium]|nr:carboxypeptidase regulatory-like domain-containing protein [Anaerolineae bacterium]